MNYELKIIKEANVIKAVQRYNTDHMKAAKKCHKIVFCLFFVLFSFC